LLRLGGIESRAVETALVFGQAIKERWVAPLSDAAGFFERRVTDSTDYRAISSQEASLSFGLLEASVRVDISEARLNRRFVRTLKGRGIPG
jgi:hypothetical protein